MDGAEYLGWDGFLLLPTNRRPTLPMVALLPALRRHCVDRVGDPTAPPAAADDLIVLLPWAALIGPRPRHPADPGMLAQFLGGRSAHPVAR